MPIAPPRPPDPPPTSFVVESYLDTNNSPDHWNILGLPDEWWLPMERLTYYRTRGAGMIPLATLYDIQRLGSWLEKNATGALPLGNIFVGNALSVATATPMSQVPVSNWGPANKTVWMGTGPSYNFISNLKTPLLEHDAATKGYVDSLSAAPQINELSLWGRMSKAPPIQGPGTSIFPASGPTLSVPVAFNLPENTGATRTMGFRRSFFYGRITIEDRAHKTFTFNHGLNTKDFVVMVRERGSQEIVFPGITFPSANAFQVRFKSPPAGAPPGETAPLPTMPMIFTVLAVGVEQMDAESTPAAWEDDYYVEAAGS